MIAILTALARPLLDAFASAFGRVLLDALKTWQMQDAAVKRGRAEAVRDAAVTAAAIQDEMAAVPVPDVEQVVTALRKGEA